MITAATPAQKAAGRPNSMLRSDACIGYKVSGGAHGRHDDFPRLNSELNVIRDLRRVDTRI